MYLFVANLAEKLGTDKSNLFHRIKRDGIKTQLRPRMTASGPQRMAVVPQWYAERLIELYETANANGAEKHLGQPRSQFIGGLPTAHEESPSRTNHDR